MKRAFKAVKSFEKALGKLLKKNKNKNKHVLNSVKKPLPRAILDLFSRSSQSAVARSEGKLPPFCQSPRRCLHAWLRTRLTGSGPLIGTATLAWRMTSAVCLMLLALLCRKPVLY